jgi:phage replication O-like protein O
MSAPDRFVRFPTDLLEALLRVQLSETQWRILLWVIRQTYGWNRNAIRFSWYRIAKDLSVDRGGIVRAGHKLLGAGVLYVQDGQLGIQREYAEWDRRILVKREDHPYQLWMPAISAETHHPNPRAGDIDNDAGPHRGRCQESSVFRRSKDSSKDNLKTFKNIVQTRDDALQRKREAESTKRPLLPSGADPVPGKYDGVSEN